MTNQLGMGQPNPSSETIGAGPVPEAAGGEEPALSQPLGQPRVKSWKSGAGPSAEDAGRLRDQYGSKTAARILNTTQREVQSLAPRMNPRGIPSEVQSTIDQALASLDPTAARAYADRAPNPMIKAYIESKLTPEPEE
jgi:hypothetical protein